MVHKNYESERDLAAPLPRRYNDGVGRQVTLMILQIVFSGSISGAVAWAGISAKQQVMETNIRVVTERAIEDRAQFTATLTRMSEELSALTRELQQLAIQEAKIEAANERKQNR